jgi:hypothetical protein
MKKSRVPYRYFGLFLLIGLVLVNFRRPQRHEVAVESIPAGVNRSVPPFSSQLPPADDVQLARAAKRFLKQPSDTNGPKAAGTSSIDPRSRDGGEPARLVDRLESYQELERHVAKINEHTARVTRLLSTPLKYSRIRTTETVDTRTGRILSHTAESGDHVIVKFQSNPTKQDLDFLLDSYGLSFRKKMETENTYILSISDPDLWAIDRAAEALEKLDFVAFSEPDFIILDSRRK